MDAQQDRYNELKTKILDNVKYLLGDGDTARLVVTDNTAAIYVNESDYSVLEVRIDGSVFGDTNNDMAKKLKELVTLHRTLEASGRSTDPEWPDMIVE